MNGNIVSEFDKMVQGLKYNTFAKDIVEIRKTAFALIQKINGTIAGGAYKELAQLFGSFGKNSMVTPPFLCEFGKTISIGKNSFINMGVTMLDNSSITIGDNVLIGPSTQFYTVSHPLDYEKRRKWESSSAPIIIEDDVWIGGNVVIFPGVTIGARSVVAAGSVVTKSMPSNSLIGGTPSKVIRNISEE